NGVPSQFLCSKGFFVDLSHSSGERIRIIHGHEIPVFSVTYGKFKTAYRRGNNRSSAGHRFKRCYPEWLVPRGRYKDISGAVVVFENIAAQRSYKADFLFDMLFLSNLLQGGNF